MSETLPAWAKKWHKERLRTLAEIASAIAAGGSVLVAWTSQSPWAIPAALAAALLALLLLRVALEPDVGPPIWRKLKAWGKSEPAQSNEHDTITVALCAQAFLRKQSAAFEDAVVSAMSRKPDIERLIADANCAPDNSKQWSIFEKETSEWRDALAAASIAYFEVFGIDEDLSQRVFYPSQGPLQGADQMDRRKAAMYRRFYDQLSHALPRIDEMRRRFRMRLNAADSLVLDFGKQSLREGH